MIRNRNFVCLSTSEWGGNYAKTIVEIMSVLARENKVLYVDYQFTWKDLLMSLLGKSQAPVARMLGLKKRLQTVHTADNQDVLLLTPPPIFPVAFLPDGPLYRFMLRCNGRLVARAVRKVIRQHQMGEELIHINAFNPAMGEVTAFRFGEKQLIYHCYDEIEAAAWLKKHGGKHERTFMKQAHAVITTSEGLFQKKSPLTNRCFLVKNAVNFDLFRTGYTDRTRMAGKRIGYIGSIDDRLDYELLEHLFKTLPDHQFDFVGRYDYEKGRKILQQYPNVTLHGPHPVSALPGFLKEFSAGIIPFAINDFNKGIYPLKINEYLATGLPVVMTHFAIVEEFRPVASIAENKEEFRDMLVKEVQHNSVEKQEARVNFAAANSWEARIEQISDIVRQLDQELR